MSIDTLEPDPSPAAPPVLNAGELRRLAEAVSGYRGTDPYWLVLTQDAGGELQYEISIIPPGPRPDAVVLPCQTPRQAERPPVVSATIRAAGGPEVNLLDLEMEDDEGNAVHRADAVFWGESSIEKFVVPYYASVYGHEAGEAVSELLETYNGTATEGAQAQLGEEGTTVVDVYGLVHIPRSEYVEMDTAPAPERAARHHRFAVLAMDRATGRHRIVTVEAYRERRGG
ncbi:MAG TPA: hypothetical protein VJT67_00930 [Longimicrobiaceae bacterium]|nr:hypothetical protein [Longimicrobiaceae bacterium]